MNHHVNKNKYITIFSLVVALLAVILIEYYADRKERSFTLLKAGHRFPSINVRSLSGEEESFDDRIRKRMVLVVFSTSCVHCIDEIQFWNEYASRADKSLDVKALSADDPLSTETFVKEHHITLPVFTGVSKDVMDSLHVRSVPVVFFIDGEKLLRKVITGNQPKERVRRLLGEFLQSSGVEHAERR